MLRLCFANRHANQQASSQAASAFGIVCCSPLRAVVRIAHWTLALQRLKPNIEPGHPLMSSTHFPRRKRAEKRANWFRNLESKSQSDSADATAVPHSRDANEERVSPTVV